MSMKPDKPKAVLHAPEQAIDSYLAALLSEVEEYHETPVRTETPPAPEKPRLAPVVEIRQGVQTLDPPRQASTVETARSVDTSLEEAAQSAAAEEIVPPWGMSRFQGLPFKVRGMNLVVPLVSLCSIAEWQQDLIRLPGQPDWSMGVFMHRGRRVVVIDTARLIMPDRLEKVSAERPRGSHILIIGDGRWGLACDSLLSPLNLEKQDVRWRRRAGARAWMAGTLIEQLSVLLNVDELLAMVEPQR